VMSLSVLSFTRARASASSMSRSFLRRPLPPRLYGEERLLRGGLEPPTAGSVDLW
jgi:hypothetical protein